MELSRRFSLKCGVGSSRGDLPTSRCYVVEFRVEQHYERLGDQFVRLGYDITSCHKARGWAGNETPARNEVEAGEDVPEWARRDSTRDLLLRSAGPTINRRQRR